MLLPIARQQMSAPNASNPLRGRVEKHPKIQRHVGCGIRARRVRIPPGENLALADDTLGGQINAAPSARIYPVPGHFSSSGVARLYRYSIAGRPISPAG
jgi:hypothetical protein